MQILADQHRIIQHDAIIEHNMLFTFDVHLCQTCVFKSLTNLQHSSISATLPNF